MSIEASDNLWTTLGLPQCRDPLLETVVVALLSGAVMAAKNDRQNFAEDYVADVVRFVLKGTNLPAVRQAIDPEAPIVTPLIQTLRLKLMEAEARAGRAEGALAGYRDTAGREDESLSRVRGRLDALEQFCNDLIKSEQRGGSDSTGGSTG